VHKDTYSNYAHLAEKEKEETDYRVRVVHRQNATLVIIAPHGGEVDPER
jgi:phage replication-related protein YjqB (UPF0714/DUF867 family)